MLDMWDISKVRIWSDNNTALLENIGLSTRTNKQYNLRSNNNNKINNGLQTQKY